MDAFQNAVDSPIAEIARARIFVSKIKSAQVKNSDHLDFLKATAYSWFNSHRRVLQSLPDADCPGMSEIDVEYQRILDSTEKFASRQTYLGSFTRLKALLLVVRSKIISRPMRSTDFDAPPNFSTLAGDPGMQKILDARWLECQKCIHAKAPLAATVMMGGLLEALFVARANSMADKSLLFKAKTAPIDGKTKKVLDFREWTLRPYIDVGHELEWISKSGKDVAEVLRDYRNYIHPEKERSHGIVISDDDSKLFWDLTRNLSIQLLRIK